MTVIQIDPPYPAYRGLRFEEDRALETFLSGVTVPDAKGTPRKVQVIYRFPEREEQPGTPPYFLIDFLTMTPRRNEEHRGIVTFGMEPYTGNYLPGTHGATSDFPLPILLHYQVSVVSRAIQHDVILNDLCATTFFPFRFGQLTCPSGTVRRLDFESMTSADTTDHNQQRLFRKIWRFNISAEIVFPYQTSVSVTRVNATVTDTADGHIDATVHSP